MDAVEPVGKTYSPSRKPNARLLILAPTIVLAFCLTFTFYIWRLTSDNIAYQTRLKFEKHTEEIKLLIKWRLELYISALYGALGLFAADDHVDRREWAAYVRKEDLTKRYPGIVARSFIERVPAKDKEAFAESVRSDTSLRPSGYPDFRIYPEGDHPEYFVVKYVEPYEGNEKSLGFDMGSDGARFAALAFARDSGIPAATGRLNVMTGTGEEAGFSVFMPIYKNGAPVSTMEERRAALIGFVDATFKVNDLLWNILSKETIPSNIDFEIFVREALSREQFLYRHSDRLANIEPVYSPKFIATTALKFVSKVWSFHFKSLPQFELGDIKQYLPTFVLVAGISFSFLIFGILYSTNASRTIRDINVGLEREIAERKRIEAELREAKKSVEEASQAKSKFLANLSHELRTPLSAVIGFSEVLKSESFGPLNDKQKEYTTDILESGRHLLSFIGDILDLSKVEAGKMELTPSEFDLKALLEQSLLVIKHKAHAHNIKLSLAVEDGVGPIHADERKVRQIVFNLLSNAAKFTPDGGSVMLKAIRVSSEEVLVSVHDTGVGIEAKDREKVFTEFEQIETSLSGRYAGTGLGMPLAKKFVELHGGKIWFESEGQSKGTTFYFTLPVTRMARRAA